MRRLAGFVLGMLWLAALAAAPATAAGMDPVLAWTNGDGLVNDAVVVGDLSYCASGGGLTIWDISGSTPRYVGGCNTRGFAISVAVAGHRAYVGTITLFFLPWTLEVYGGMEAVDISRPARPTLLGRCDVPPMYPGQMAVSDSGDYVYVVQGGFGLWIFDVSDPGQPVVAGTYPVPPSSEPCGCVLDVATAGDYAYLATDYGLTVVDVSAPAAPVELGPCSGVENAFSVAITGGYAVANSWSGNPLSVLDISDPANPVVIGAYAGDLGTGWAWLAAAGTMACVLDQYAGILRVIGLAEPTAPELVAQLPVSESFACLVANPTTVCLIPVGFNMEWNSIMTLVDVSDPAHPVIMGSTPATGVPFAVAARDGYAFVVDAGKLQAVDVSDPRAPGLLGSCDLFFWGVATVKTAGDYAYLAIGGGGLQIVDVSDPTSLVHVAYALFGGNITDAAVAGDYAYAVDSWWQDITAVYASGPQIGQEVGGCPYYYGQAIAAEGTHLYATALGGVLDVFDISDPLHPTPVGECSTAAYESRTVAVSNGYAYIAGYRDGLAIVDVTDPAAPHQVAVVPAAEGIWDVAVDGRYAYLADDEAGVRVVDISTPDTPVEVGYCQTWGAAVGVAVSGDSICVADYGWGLDVLHRAPVFTDVPDDYWASGEIIACYRANIVSGYWDDTYRPALSVPRDQMAVYVARTLAGGEKKVPSGPETPTFSDVAADYWAYDEIEYCHAQGVVEGYEDDTYRPTLVVNRGTMAVYMARAMVAPAGDAAVPEPPAPHFPDVAAANESWCYKHVEYCYDHGVVKGYEDGTYRPGVQVHRDQMAVYVQRAFGLPM